MNGVLGSVRPLQGADGTFQGFVAETIMKVPCTESVGRSDGVTPRDLHRWGVVISPRPEGAREGSC